MQSTFMLLGWVGVYEDKEGIDMDNYFALSDYSSYSYIVCYFLISEHG